MSSRWSPLSKPGGPQPRVTRSARTIHKSPFQARGDPTRRDTRASFHCTFHVRPPLIRQPKDRHILKSSAGLPLYISSLRQIKTLSNASRVFSILLQQIVEIPDIPDSLHPFGV